MTNPKLSVEERNRLAGEQAELQPKVEALNAERAVLHKRRRNWRSAARSTA